VTARAARGAPFDRRVRVLVSRDSRGAKRVSSSRDEARAVAAPVMDDGATQD